MKKEVEELTTTRDALISANKELVSTNDILAKENEGLKKEVSNNEATINDAIKVLTKTK